MTIEEAAKRVRVDRRTIQRWISEGRLRTTRQILGCVGGGAAWRHDISIFDLIECEAEVVDACIARDNRQRVG